MKIKCSYKELVDINSLKPHPKNANAHPMHQIERLAKILEYQGWRSPIVISKLSGYVVAGHGRLEAAKFNKYDKVPVDFQDFDSEAKEYAHLTADNAIGLWAELDKEKIKLDALGIEGLDDEMLALENFEIKDFEINPIPEVNEKNEIENFVLTVECPDELQQEDLYRELLDRSFIVRKK